MTPEPSDDRDFHVTVFAAPDDPHELANVLADVLGMHPTDAMIHSRLVPGILPDRLSRERANRLVAAVNDLGLHAESISTDEIPVFSHGEAVHHVRCTDAGLEIFGLHGGLDVCVPWDEIELVCVGVVPQETAKHYLTSEMMALTAARRTTHLALEVPLSPGPELWFIRRHPFHVYRVDHKRMNYEYLGDRNSDSATVNFSLFLDDFLRHASHAYVTPSTRAFLGHGTECLYHFDSSDHLQHYAQFHCLAHRRAAQKASAPAGTRIGSPASAGPGSDGKITTTDVPALRAPGQIDESNPALELLDRALSARATDVHIDPISSDEFKVRFRIDGRLQQFCILDRSVGGPLLMQLKVMSNIDIARPFEPNEGRVQLPPSMADTEVRMTTVPVAGGDAVALRLLKHEATPPSLNQLGFSAQAMEAVNGMLRDGEGIVLVTGPTGSGKTTTVHAMLRMLDNGERNLMSIEDPVEYRVPAIRQMSVDVKHGMTMTRGLRTLLRMDPDVVFIGEIRDVEAMEIALRAASSGKYVFSTLHTRDVASTVTALRDLNADNLSLGGNLKGIVSQRLMRCLCRECCCRSGPSEIERRKFLAEGVEPPQLLPRPNGCPFCRNTGFHGRIGVFEAVRTTGDIAEAIQRGTAEDELRRMIRSAGTTSLMADALAKVRDGVTSPDEALSIKWA